MLRAFGRFPRSPFREPGDRCRALRRCRTRPLPPAAANEIAETHERAGRHKSRRTSQKGNLIVRKISKTAPCSAILRLTIAARGPVVPGQTCQRTIAADEAPSLFGRHLSDAPRRIGLAIVRPSIGGRKRQLCGVHLRRRPSPLNLHAICLTRATWKCGRKGRGARLDRVGSRSFHLDLGAGSGVYDGRFFFAVCRSNLDSYLSNAAASKLRPWRINPGLYLRCQRADGPAGLCGGLRPDQREQPGARSAFGNPAVSRPQPVAIHHPRNHAAHGDGRLRAGRGRP